MMKHPVVSTVVMVLTVAVLLAAAFAIQHGCTRRHYDDQDIVVETTSRMEKIIKNEK